MATVSVTIDGKTYRMACDEGQEEHLSGLAGRFNQYVTHLKSSFGEIGDLRLTVMAGIMVMDELKETQKRLSALEADMANLRRAREDALSDMGRNEADLSKSLGDMATRLESLAARIVPNNGR